MSLNKKIAIGAVWSLVTRLSIKGLGLISTILLARLLFPEDFGLIAITMMMVAFFEVFANFSFDVNIIQKDDVDDELLNSAWTCRLLSGVILTGLLMLSSPFISSFFNDERLTLIVLVVSAIPLIKSTENIGFVLFRKNLNLQKEFKLEVVAKLMSFTATIVSAYLLRNYWALIIGMFVNAFSRVALSYLMHSFRPSWSLKRAAELISFSKWLLLNNLLIFFNHKITDLIIGNKTNPTELGYYSVGYEISNLPTTELVFPLSRALFPGYAVVKNDLARMRKLFLEFTTVVVFITAPISLGIYSVAAEAVQVLLGEKWLPVIPIISLLAIYGFTRCAAQNIGSVFVALGKPKIPVLISSARLLVIIPVLLYFVEQDGAKGAALAICLVAGVTLPMSYVICASYLKLSVKNIVGIFLFPVAASLAMSYGIFAMHETFSEWFNNNTVLMLIAKVLMGALVYSICVVIYVNFAPKDNVIVNIVSKAKAKAYSMVGSH